jgi:hypothetical protein
VKFSPFSYFFHLHLLAFLFSLSFSRPVCHKKTEIASHPSKRKGKKGRWKAPNRKSKSRPFKKVENIILMTHTEGIVFRVDSFITALSRCNDGGERWWGVSRAVCEQNHRRLVRILFRTFVCALCSFVYRHIHRQSVCFRKGGDQLMLIMIPNGNLKQNNEYNMRQGSGYTICCLNKIQIDFE